MNRVLSYSSSHSSSSDLLYLIQSPLIELNSRSDTIGLITPSTVDFGPSMRAPREQAQNADHGTLDTLTAQERTPLLNRVANSESSTEPDQPEWTHLAQQLSATLHQHPLRYLTSTKFRTIQPILSHPNIDEIAHTFMLNNQGTLLDQLSNTLPPSELSDALILLMQNQPFRDTHYHELRSTVHQLDQPTCLALLALLDAHHADHATPLERLTARTLALREYGNRQTINRLDLFAGAIPVTAREIRFRTGSDYLFNGLVKRLTETRDHQDYYHLIMHEYLEGAFTQAFNQLLIQKQQQGVNIRIILCQAGCWQWNPYSPMHAPKESQLIQALRNAGIEVRIQPLAWGLEHEKGILYKIKGEWGMMMGGGTVCDQTAYPIGGPRFGEQRDELGFPWHDPNDIPEYYDMMFEAKGAITNAFQNVFLQRWLYLGGSLDPEWDDERVIRTYFHPNPPLTLDAPLTTPTATPTATGLHPSSDTTTPPLLPIESTPDEQITFYHNVPYTEGEAHNHILRLLSEAESSIHIENPYLLIDDILDLCKGQAHQGVSVKYLLPGAAPRTVEGLTNMAMSAWFEEHLEAEAVDIRLCHDRYNHGKLIVIDIENPDKAVAIVMTGNLEPVTSGGSRGGITFDSVAIMSDLTPDTLTQLRAVITRDFSDAFSYSLTHEEVRSRACHEKWLAKSMLGTLQYFFPS